MSAGEAGRRATPRATGLSATLRRLRRPLRTGQTGDLRLHRVAAGAWLWRGYFSNAAALELDGALVVVDALASPRLAARMRRDLAAVTGKPIAALVWTHFHGDHVGGSSAFADVPQVASAQTAAAAESRGEERRAYADAFGLRTGALPAVARPTETFAGERHQLRVGDDALELLHLGATETDDAIVVWWPQRRVVVSGDALATAGFPYSGAPIGDEGLRADGAWIGALGRLRALEPEVLLPGHGPPLVGRAAIAARIDRVATLYADVLEAVDRERAQGGDAHAVVARACARLHRYGDQADLPQNAISLRMTALRALHALTPGRSGGFWADLGPRSLPPAAPDVAAARLRTLAAGPAVLAAARAEAAAGAAGPARDLLRAAAARDPADAAAYLGASAWLLLGASRQVASAYEGSDALVEAGADAERALALAPGEPSALLTLGALEVLGGILMGQEMDGGLERLQRALGGKAPAVALNAAQRRAACFFVGKAHQFEGRADEAERWLRQALPPWLRPAYPLLRARLWALP